MARRASPQPLVLFLLAALLCLIWGSTWVVIEGGNHAQFGYYGTQLGDCSATIGRGDQQDQTFDAVLTWLEGNVNTARVPPAGEPIRAIDPP